MMAEREKNMNEESGKHIVVFGKDDTRHAIYMCLGRHRAFLVYRNVHHLLFFFFVRFQKMKNDRRKGFHITFNRNKQN